MSKRSEIQEFYSGRSVFITGVSGFLGKAVLEKLLRSCPDVDKVYVLIREKRGNDSENRLKKIFNLPIFNTLKKSTPEAIKKVVAIAGDITLPDLGINLIDRKTLCKIVSVVIHSAASIKFNEPLKIALNINYYGTKRVVELCEQMESLVAFVHVSTAYSNCDLFEIHEEIIVPDQGSLSPQEIELMTDIEAEKITAKIIGQKPNTYTYAKFQAEYLLQENCSKLPISIVRPSIITAAWKEPEPGFVDSLNGLTGILAASGKGLISSVVCDKTKISDIIPLDITVNLILASAWEKATEKTPTISVYNCCSGTINPITWSEIRNHGLAILQQRPFKNAVRDHKPVFVTSSILNMLLNFWTTYLPLFFMDCIAFVFGRKPRLIKILNQMLTALDATKYFHLNEWKFRTENMVKLENSMKYLDREIFFFNIRDINWKEYFTNYYNGIQKFIFKEDVSTFSKKSRIIKNRMGWIKKFGFLIVFLFLISILL